MIAVRSDARITIISSALYRTSAALETTQLALGNSSVVSLARWAPGRQIIGRRDDAQVLFDTDRGEFVGELGTRAMFPSPGGDVALSPDAKWFVNGYRSGGDNVYAILRRSNGAFVRTRRFDQHGWTTGELRNDPAPCWNRDGTQILFPAFSTDGEATRQLYLMKIETTP